MNNLKTFLVGSDAGSYTPNAGTLTISLTLGYTVKLEELLYIFNETQNVLYHDIIHNKALCSISNNVIIINGSEDPIGANDIIHIRLHDITGLSVQGYDNNQDALKVIVENDLPGNWTSPESLVSSSDIGATDDVWKDQGAEIDCRRFKTVGIYTNLTVNDSVGNQLQVLVKHESGGADEYTLDTSSEYQKTLGNSDRKPFYTFGVEGIIYIQIQTKATDVDTGGGTEGTVSIEITKEY